MKKILFITLSNIGDAILTLPALDYLRQRFPEAKITVMVSARPKEIFEHNPNIDRIIVYDKKASLVEQVRLFFALQKEKFDLIVDLRNTFLGAVLSAPSKTNPFLSFPSGLKHMKDRHLYKIKNSKFKIQNFSDAPVQKSSLPIKPEDEEYIRKILKDNGITEQDKIIAVAAGARSHIKRWPQERFPELVRRITGQLGAKVILVGDKDDAAIVKQLLGDIAQKALDLSGKTDLMELACLLKFSSCVVTNDSAVLHLASYLNRPVVAIFGPTDAEKYGPWSDNFVVVKKDIFCRPCEKAQCRFGTVKCMEIIQVEDVMRALRNVFTKNYELRATSYKRILIVRTDRIGDVLLSTPVIKALREASPQAYIAMMVSPNAKDIVEGNPYLDEVIVYDKDGKHKKWRRSIKFALNLRKKKFDLAVILHPINRAHLVTFFAGIPKRVGYGRKMGFLLTDKIKHTKHLGEKHESEYNLDLVRHLGIEPKDKDIFMPIRPESERWVNELFKEEGIMPADKLLAIHPCASCPSKIWPRERFTQLADKLVKKYGFKVFLVAGSKDVSAVESIAKHLPNSTINLGGRVSISQLASVLKRCQLFISNDSGPVHIASAVGTPVISIFGRNQAGLSPKRWGPLGKKDKFLHKSVGCITCLAHNCKKDFACLKAISVDDVLKVADEILKI